MFIIVVTLLFLRMNNKGSDSDNIDIQPLAEEMEGTALFEQRLEDIASIPKAVEKDAKAAVVKAKAELKRNREVVADDLNLKKRRVELMDAVEEIERGPENVYNAIGNIVHKTASSRETRRKQRKLNAMKRKARTTQREIQLAMEKAKAELEIYERELERSKTNVMAELKEKTLAIDARNRGKGVPSMQREYKKARAMAHVFEIEERRRRKEIERAKLIERGKRLGV